MRKPKEHEKVICPHDDRYKLTPAKVWDTENPKGEKIVYGILGPHMHSVSMYQAKNCTYDLPLEIVNG